MDSKLHPALRHQKIISRHNEKVEYAYTTGTLGTVQKTVNYAYGDSSWGDLLTSHGGKAISYDTIGNPLSDGTWNYTWEHGRELASMSNGSATWNFTYNADGLRTKRTNGSTTYNYTYVGDRLSYMTVGSDRIYFIYDAEGIPIAARWNDANYYYVSNIQGDIVAIVNSTGTAVVEYTYDAWGNIISTTGSMASTLGTLNPLRYRAYVYDQETGLYYLQSRYYNPTTGRFISADAFTATGQGLLGNNMFAYCNNNPVRYSDPKGTFINTLTGALVGGLIGAISAWMNNDDIMAGAAIGAATGALAGAAADFAIATGGIGGVAIAVVGGAMSSGLNYAGTEKVNGRDIEHDRLALEMTVGAAANMLTFGSGGGSLIKRGGKVLNNLVDDFSSTVMKNTTKTVAGKTVYKTGKTVTKHIMRNAALATAETAVIGTGAWLNANAWGRMLQ